MVAKSAAVAVLLAAALGIQPCPAQQAPAAKTPAKPPAQPAAPATQLSGDLATALNDLERIRREHSDLRRALYKKVNELDDQAITLGKELRALERDEEQRTARERSLERELEARKVETDYVTGVLKQYSQALLTRLHPAENQRYREELETAGRRAEAATSNLAGEITERITAAEIGLRRLGDITGGSRFDGRALRNGSESIEGRFAVLGPAVFFAGSGFEGVATFAQTGTELPTVVAIRGVTAGAIDNAITNGKGELPFDSSMGKALEIEAARESLAETIEKGGMVGYAIMLLGGVALVVTLFKLVEIGRFPVPPRRTINAIIDHLVGDRQPEAEKLAATLRGMSGEMVRTGVNNFYSKRRVLEEALFEKLVAIRPRLDRFLPFLALTAAASPLMGLLGTVLGIIKTFKAMAIYGTGNAKNFSAGISEALITTAQGLIVAIPVLVLHGLMKSYSKAKFSEIEALAVSIMNGTTELDKDAPAPATDDGPGDDDFELGGAKPEPA